MATGKKAARKRRKVGYESDVPTCARCVSFRGSGMYLINSMPQWSQHRCMKHEFNVKERGCCDHWVCKYTGATLDREPA